MENNVSKKRLIVRIFIIVNFVIFLVSFFFTLFAKNDELSGELYALSILYTVHFYLFCIPFCSLCLSGILIDKKPYKSFYLSLIVMFLILLISSLFWTFNMSRI